MLLSDIWLNTVCANLLSQLITHVVAAGPSNCEEFSNKMIYVPGP